MKKLCRTGFNGSFLTLEDGVADYIGKFLVEDDKYR